ncbi:MAG: acetate kinase [Odoribacteraceae bacterium]|jgi:acetate kinase|nr:acetate kinase [Odoribacteraceae bacterium]
MNILVLNCGSSSIKYQLLDMAGEPLLLAKGIVDKITLPGGKFTHKPAGKATLERETPIPDHAAGVNLILEALVDGTSGVLRSLSDIFAVGHRVAHGGEFFSGSVLIDAGVKEKIAACGELAPLHNPAHLTGIEALERRLPGVPQVAVFDTSFHQTLPREAYLYGLPLECYRKHGIRRYGFHGTSHQFVAGKACRLLGWNVNEKKIITCHLGNGSSITAIDRGRSVDTSMGFTPTAGVLMGTRTGDVDPGALLFLIEKEGLDADGANALINKRSGLLGVSGLTPDCRELWAAVEEGNEEARLALDMLVYQVKKYIGSYMAVLNGADLVVFTGGIGENDHAIRGLVCREMQFLGIHFDDEANAGVKGKDKVLSRPGSPVTVMSINTDEELVIATDTLDLTRHLAR